MSMETAGRITTADNKHNTPAVNANADHPAMGPWVDLICQEWPALGRDKVFAVAADRNKLVSLVAKETGMTKALTGTQVHELELVCSGWMGPAQKTQARFKAALERVQARLQGRLQGMMDMMKGQTSRVDQGVRNHALASVAMAAVLGLLTGALVRGQTNRQVAGSGTKAPVR